MSGDTPVETAVKIATMEIGLLQVGRDVQEVKEDTKRMAHSLEGIKQAAIHTDGILNLINQNQKQSQERWTLLQTRQEKENVWRSQVDVRLASDAGALRMLKWIVAILTSSGGVAFIAWLFKGHL